MSHFIRLFPVLNMKYTIFREKPEKLAQRGVVLTDDPKTCDLFVAHHFPFDSTPWQHWIKCQVARLKYRLHKPLLIWTHEPRASTVTEQFIPARGALPDIHIMNAYTQDVFVGNHAIYHWALSKQLPLLTEPPSCFTYAVSSNKRPIVALTGYVQNPPPLFIGGRNIDLIARRQHIITVGYDLGMVDIYGKRWPKKMCCGESREGAWHQKKLAILKNYRFNLALENTNIDYYCSEKIWDSIYGGCLPIYHGEGNRIYEDLPENSFIDHAHFPRPEALFDFIRNMSAEEIMVRMNRCIEALNIVIRDEKIKIQEAVMLDRLLARIYAIIEGCYVPPLQSEVAS